MLKRPGRWILAVAGVIFLGVAVFVMRTSDTQVKPPTLSGRVWSGDGAQPSVLLYVTREERSMTRRTLGRSGSFFAVRYDRYALHVRRVDNGTLLHTLALGDFKEIDDTRAPRILGVIGEVVWLWRDGPESRTIAGLELQCDLARLRQHAPDLAAFVPQSPKGFAVVPHPRALVMRGRDATLYRIDSAAATITPIAAEDLPPSNFTTRAEDRFNYLIAPGQSRLTTHPYGLLQKSFLTRTGHWYALLSESERSGLSKWPQEDRPHGDVARMFHRADYTMDGGQPAIDPAAVTRVGDVRLLQSGFIIRTQGAVWDVPEPSSSLALAKSLLGDDEPWEVVRLGRDGQILWRTSTDLADLGEMLDAGRHVVFIGKRVAHGSRTGPVRDTRDRIVVIDTAAGIRHTLFVGSGELEPAVKR